jgi:tRNA dimethylallyltransferase
MRPAILIHGPTASGKTRLAIALARRFGGEIVNADAMQVYADLDVLTARPDAEEKAAAPHHLFGHVDAASRYSAGTWAKEAGPLIRSLMETDRTPIVVGGTGLYLMALTEGLSEIPPIPEAARTEARAMVAGNVGAAFANLVAKDPPAKERIEPQDRQRIARALEVLIATGRPISSFHGEAAPVLLPGDWLGAALTPPREPLYDRINARVDMGAKARSRTAGDARARHARIRRSFRGESVADRGGGALQTRHAALRQAADDLDRASVHRLATGAFRDAGRAGEGDRGDVQRSRSTRSLTRRGPSAQLPNWPKDKP